MPILKEDFSALIAAGVVSSTPITAIVTADAKANFKNSRRLFFMALLFSIYNGFFSF
jgi:hypothetical protein